jgi:hypothetical protein
MLTIANLTAHYFIPQGTPNPALLRARLDQLLQQRLPAAVSGRLQPLAADDEAVYRIRQLAFDLGFDSHSMDDHELVERSARLILRMVTHALLYGAPGDMMRFDDHAHYVAAFLGDLLRGQAWSRWVYEEFQPLRDLPIGQIAAQLLGARPALVIPVARRLAQAHQLEPMIQQLQLDDIRLIGRTGLGWAAPPPTLPLSDQLAAWLRLLTTQIDLERKSDATTAARNTLRIFLAVMLAQPVRDSGSVVALAHHLATLLSLWSARPAPALWQALANGEIDSPAALEPLLLGLGSDLAAAAHWLQTVLADRAGRHYLAQLVPVALPDVAGPAFSTNQRRRPATKQAKRLTSAFAGLALLLPPLRQAAIYHQVGSAGLYQLLLAAVGRTLQPLAWGDEGIAWLAGLPADEMEAARAATIHWPDAQQTAKRLGVTLPVDEEDPLAAQVYAITRGFAHGLRGVGQSSAAYLAQNFFHLAGTLVRSDDTLEIHLHRAPLGVLLQMAGRTGDQGTLPWLAESTLRIFLPAG